MDDANETRLRQRFAMADAVVGDESFVMRLRVKRARMARRQVLLRRLFVAALLLAVLLAVRLLLPWLDQVLREAESLVARILQVPHSPGAMALPLAVAGAVGVGIWAWRQALPRD